MDTLFIFWALIIFAICISKGFGTLAKSKRKTLGSFKVNDSDKPTSMIRLYKFDKTYDPQSFFYRKEREIMVSSLPDNLIRNELKNLREQYKAFLDSKKK